MVFEFYLKNFFLPQTAKVWAVLVCLGFSSLAHGLVSTQNIVLLNQEKIKFISEKIACMLDNLSGGEDSDKLLHTIKTTKDKLEQACVKFADKDLDKRKADWQFFQIELKKSVFKLGEAVAAHPEKDKLLLDFWLIFRKISEAFAWPNFPKIKDDLFNRMLWVEFWSDPAAVFVADLVKGFMGASAVFLTVCKLTDEYRKFVAPKTVVTEFGGVPIKKDENI